MTDYLILGVIAVAVMIGLISTARHFKGQGGCCGGGGYRPKRKKLKHIQYQKTFLIQGMHCDHCKARVEEVVNDIPGVAGQADYKKGELKISYEKEVPDDLIRSRLHRAGYPVTGQKS